jgi:hypothetical protein
MDVVQVRTRPYKRRILSWKRVPESSEVGGKTKELYPLLPTILIVPFNFRVLPSFRLGPSSVRALCDAGVFKL